MEKLSYSIFEKFVRERIPLAGESEEEDSAIALLSTSLQRIVECIGRKAILLAQAANRSQVSDEDMSLAISDYLHTDSIPENQSISSEILFKNETTTSEEDFCLFPQFSDPILNTSGLPASTNLYSSFFNNQSNQKQGTFSSSTTPLACFPDWILQEVQGKPVTIGNGNNSSTNGNLQPSSLLPVGLASIASSELEAKKVLASTNLNTSASVESLRILLPHHHHHNQT